MPAFSYRHVKDLYPVFWAKSVEMINLIQEDLNNSSRKTSEETDTTVQISNWASRTTLDIIGVAGMDHDFDSLRDPDNTLNQSYRQIMASPPTYMKILFVIGMLMGNPTWTQTIPTKRNKEIAESGEVIRNVARQMIRQKKAKMEDPKAETGIDIISVALKSGTFDEENLVDQSMTFLGAGHETTATALQWAIYALCKNPDVQTKLRAEVRANLPSPHDDTPISAADIDNLPYLNAVCNETLRFYPSVPTTIRKAVRDTTLAGKHIPKDTTFTLCPRIINRMEEFWGDDADSFNPERFMGPGKANTGGATSNYALLTFLHGPRSCIGQGFAKAELACMVAAMVGRFNIALKYPDAKLEVREGATVSPKDGVVTLITPLEGW
jgi:cytochrome P450